MNLEPFARGIERDGWYISGARLDSETIGGLCEALGGAYQICREVQTRNGITASTDGTAHHALILDHRFLDFVDRHLPFECIEHFFGGRFIINSFGGIINMKEKPSYVCNVHRDVRSFSGDTPVMLNMLVMLDEFTLENGATYLLTGSHKKPDKPDDEYFFSHADRAVGPAGSLMFFNSNLWHAAGRNTTARDRRALTVTFTRPFMKQQLDYPRAIGYDRVAGLSPNLLQALGYNSRTPCSLDEWYQPREKRFYQPDQG